MTTTRPRPPDGATPGLGLAWHRPESMYAVADPHPNDIQGYLPLGRPVATRWKAPSI